MRFCRICGMPIHANSRRRKLGWKCQSCAPLFRPRPTQRKSVREYKLRTKYGITLAEFEELVSFQNGKCAICRVRPAVHVDHCHVSGKTRGVLCEPCNGGLGLFRDDERIIARAIEYLSTHE